MKLLRVKARGFIGFRDGMGCEDIDVDLSGLSGLVGLSGENGRGKTTFLEVCSPFRTLASRKGKLNDHVYLRDSFKETIFEFNGDEYRCLVKIDSGSNRSEGFIYKNGAPLVNGKVTEYDSYITGLLGSQALFYSSVFCAQNAQKLSDMRPGEIKELFVEFLQLKKYEEWEQTAKRAGAYLAGSSKSLLDEIERLKKNMESLSLEMDCSELDQANFRIIDAIKDEESHLNLVQSERDIAHKKTIENESYILQTKEIHEKVISLKSQIHDAGSECDKKISAITSRIGDVRFEIKRHDDFLLLKDRICNADDLLKTKRSEIEVCEQEKNVLEHEINTTRSGIDRTNRKTDALRKGLQENTDTYIRENLGLLSRKDTIMAELNALKQSMAAPPALKTIQALENELNHHMKQVASYDGIDPDCSSKQCRFIIEAKESQSNIVPLKEKISKQKEELAQWTEKMMTAIHEKEAEIEPIIAKMHALKLSSDQTKEDTKNQIKDLVVTSEDLNRKLAELSNTHESIKTKIVILKIECDDLEIIAQKKTDITVAEEKISTLKQTEIELTKAIETIRSEKESSIQSMNQDLSALNDKLISLSSLIDESAGDRPERFQASIRKHEEIKEQLNQQRIEILSKIESAKEKAKTIDKMASDISALEDKKKTIDQEISEWNYLQYACSKKGLQILEIDGVTPLIVNDANKILHTAFGGEFTLKIVTKDEETGAEVFQIRVIKSDGREVLIENLSGGQKVWCLKALRLAMTLISKEKSGKHLQTAFADEEDGALDEEKAASFIRLYRAFMAEGQFSTCLFISHRPDVIGMADHILNFTETGIHEG